MSVCEVDASQTSLPAAPAVRFGLDEVELLLEGTEAGLALFDPDWRLVFANPRYATLCGYAPDELRPGATLQDLMRISLRRSDAFEDSIESHVARGVERLKASGGYSFQHRAASGVQLSIHRRLTADGQVVDTVKPATESADYGAAAQLAQVADAARARLSHALDAMADGFALFDADDRLVAYNAQYIGFNPHIADVIAPGRSFEEMLREGMTRSGYEIGPMSAEEFVAWRLEQHRNPGDPYDLQMTDGRWVRVHEKRTSDGGIVGIRSDITELKAREAELLRVGNELRRKSMMFETALNNMVQGLCMFDADQTLIVCNKRYLEMYRFSPEVVKPGIKLHEIMAYSVSIGNYSPEDAERAKAARPDHAKLRTQAVLKQYLRDGRVIAVMHQPMPDGGSIATYQDITELEQHETQMVAYTKRLEASNRELQDFAYVASHDLQEPLRKIETFSSRLIAKYSDNLPEQAHTYIERMQNATGRMRLLISDLLSYSRITTKAKPFERIDLNEQLGYVLSDIEIRINENNAVVEAGDLPPIDADPVQIRQLLQNLISNALKFQKPDTQPVVKISSTITPADPVISQPEMIEIRVADNGIGFDNKYKEQIFTIFQRLHGRNEYEGTGIGLATCRKIVERHGGEIDADGVEGVGATFILRLPTRHAQDATRAGSDD